MTEQATREHPNQNTWPAYLFPTLTRLTGSDSIRDILILFHRDFWQSQVRSGGFVLTRSERDRWRSYGDDGGPMDSWRTAGEEGENPPPILAYHLQINSRTMRVNWSWQRSGQELAVCRKRKATRSSSCCRSIIPTTSKFTSTSTPLTRG